jgi:6-phosphogluconolactonase (cycloisomerase 2 family)
MTAAFIALTSSSSLTSQNISIVFAQTGSNNDNFTDATPGLQSKDGSADDQNIATDSGLKDDKIIVADAGQDINVEEGDDVTLDGTQSFEKGGTITDYSWVQTSGFTQVDLKDRNSAQPSFMAPAVDTDEQLTFQLTIKDKDGKEDTDSMNVLIKSLGSPTKLDNSQPNLTGGNEDCSINQTCPSVGQQPPFTEPCTGNETDCNPPPPTPCTGNETDCNPPPPTPCTGNETDCNPPPPTPCLNNMSECRKPIENGSLVADAGPDLIVDEGSSVTLDGNGSHDTNGTISSYSWVQLSAAPLVTVEGVDGPNPSFATPQVDNDTTIRFELTVSNEYGYTSVDDVNVNIRNVNGTGKLFDTNRLKASLVDNTANLALGLTLLSYSINDSEVIVDKIDSSIAFPVNNSASIKLVPMDPGTQLEVSKMNLVSKEGNSIELNSNDKKGWILDAPTGVYTLLIDARYFPGGGMAHFGIPVEIIGNENIAPVANAGNDIIVSGNRSVSLDGSRSFDPDGNIISYHWTQVRGEPFVTIAEVDTSRPSFISPSNIKNDSTITFELRVSDNQGANSTDNMLVTLRKTIVPVLNGTLTLEPLPRVLSSGQLFEFKGMLNLSRIPDGSYVQIRNAIPGKRGELLTFGPVGKDGKFTAPWTAAPRNELMSIYASYVDIGGNEYKSNSSLVRVVGFKSSPGLSNQFLDSKPSNSEAKSGGPSAFMEVHFSDWTHDHLNVYISANDPPSQKFISESKRAVSDLSKILKEKSGNLKGWNFDVFSSNGFPSPLQTAANPINIFFSLTNAGDPSACGYNYPFQRKAGEYISNEVFTDSGCPDVYRDTMHEFLHSLGVGHTWHEKGDLMCSVEWYFRTGIRTCENDLDHYNDNSVPSEFNIRALVSAYGENGFVEPNANIPENYNPNTDTKYYCTPLPCEPGKVNSPPFADAGVSQYARLGTKVVLDGTKSFDSDGQIVYYSWTQLGGPKVTLYNPASPQPYFFIPRDLSTATKFIFKLTVTDDKGSIGFDSVDVTSNQIVQHKKTITTTNHKGIISKPKLNGSIILLGKWGSLGKGDGQFNHPASLSADSFGQRVYIADSDNNRIEVMHDSSHYVTSWGAFGIGPGQFHGPGSVSLDEAKKVVFVADIGNNRIEKFDIQGNFIKEWGRLGSANGEFDHPGDIALDPEKEVLYVTDIYNNRVQEFHYDGTFVSKWGSFGTGNGQFNRPAGITTNPNEGTVYVSDTANNHVQEFDSHGNFIRSWGSLGLANGEFARPDGIQYEASQDYIYIADRQNHRIQVFDKDGNFVTKWTTSDTKTGLPIKPRDIDLDSSGQIYVVDKANSHILVYKFSDVNPSTDLVQKQNAR